MKESWELFPKKSSMESVKEDLEKFRNNSEGILTEIPLGTPQETLK